MNAGQLISGRLHQAQPWGRLFHPRALNHSAKPAFSPSTVFARSISTLYDIWSIMGDPFSVAGSAVGVVSLGLQVCQGLASYIDKYKSADKEVKNCKCKVEGLNLILQELYDLLKGADGTDPPLSGKFKVALRMITDCESGIEDVKITLSNIQPDSSEPSQGVFPKIKTASKRALYPFRRDALVGLLTVLETLQENLDTALALLQMYVTFLFLKCPALSNR